MAEPLAAPDDWATVRRGFLYGWPNVGTQEAALAALARLRADSHAKTEALERITKLTGYWAQVGQDAQRVAHEALGSSPITALAAAAAAPKETR